MKKIIAVIIPTFRASKSIVNVIHEIPSNVTSIYVVDDACPEDAGQLVSKTVQDARVTVIYQSENSGVGGATLVGFRKAFEDGADIAVKIDSDGQIAPSLMDLITAPLELDTPQYAKGNRFLEVGNIYAMPKHRVFLNAILSFTNKFASGYYSISDPTNGLVAINKNAFTKLNTDRIAKRYFFESDMLFHLNLIRAKVHDVSMRANYGDEESNLKFRNEALNFAFGSLNNFFKRVFHRHFLINFHLPAVYILFGLPMTLYGIISGTMKLLSNLGGVVPASSGTVILPTMLTIIGINMTMQFFLLDVADEPK